MEEKNLAGNVLKLGRLGWRGIMLALIALAFFTSWVNWKQSSNHIDHATEATNRNTEAWNKNSEVLYSLKTVIETKLR